MLPVSVDCPCLLPLWYSLTFICSVSCVPYVANFLDCPCVLPLRYSLTFICSVSCVPYVGSFSGLSFCFAPSVFSKIYLSCVLCTQYCQFLWIVLLFCPFGILKNLFVLCLEYLMLAASLECPFYCPFGIL